MLRRILVALDGSAFAESVLPLAETLAQRSGATLVLAYAVRAGETLEALDPTNPTILRYVARSESAPADPLVGRDVLREARVYLDSRAKSLHNRGIKLQTAVVSGEPTEVLLDEARIRDVDLIAMSTHGRSGLGRVLYGSVAEGVITRSPVPVLLVRSSQPLSPLSSTATTMRLLVPLDGSPAAEKALPTASSLARALDADLFLIRIVPSAPTSLTGETIRFVGTRPRRPPDPFERDADAYLDDVATGLRTAGLRVSAGLASDEPAAGIVAAAEATGAAMIVMATHGRTGLGRALLGSVALDVLRRGTRPVLLVRPTAPETRPTSGTLPT